MKMLYTLALLGASPAFSANDNHCYIEAGYFQGEIKTIGIDFDGFELRAGQTFGNWMLFGGYEQTDIAPLDIAGLFRLESGSDSLRIGGGYAWPVHGRVDLVSGAGLVKADIYTGVIDLANGNDVSIIPDESDNGYFVVVGVRGRFTEKLEGEFRHRFTNVLADRANDWRVDLRYAITPAFAIGIGYRDFEGDVASTADLRWNF
ncbi:MAG TPA: hypothetical protein VF275_11180 [Gammaproteobacteria bacterium]